MSLSELGKAAAAKLHEAFKSNPKKEIDLNKVKEEAKKTRLSDATLIEDAFTPIINSPIGDTLSKGEVDEFIQSVENLSGKGKVSVYPTGGQGLNVNEKKSFYVFDAFFKHKNNKNEEVVVTDTHQELIIGSDGKFNTSDDNKDALVVIKNINSFFVDAKPSSAPVQNKQEITEVANLVKTITGENSLKNYVEQAGFVDSLKTLGIDKAFLTALNNGSDSAKKDNFKAGLTVLKKLDDYLTTKQKVTDPIKRLPAILLKGGYRLTALRGIALMVGEDTLKNNDSPITKMVIKALSTTTGTDGKAYLASFLSSQWIKPENAEAFDYVTNVSTGGPGAISKAFDQGKLLAQAKDIRSRDVEKRAKGWLSMYGKAGIGGRSYDVLPNGDISKNASTDSNMAAFSVRWLMGGLPADFETLNTQLKVMNALFDLDNIAGLFNNPAVKDLTPLAGIKPDAIQTKINEYKTLSSSSPEKFKDRMAALFATSIVSVKPSTDDNRNIKVVVSNANLLKRIMGDKIDLPQAKQILGVLSVPETQEMDMTVNTTSWDSATKADASSPAFKILDQFFNTKLNSNNPSATSTEATIVKSIAPGASTSANTSSVSILSRAAGVDLSQMSNKPSPVASSSQAQAKPATTKLNLNEVQLDADSNVSADEASLRRILKIQQDLTGVMKAMDPNSWINNQSPSYVSNFTFLTVIPNKPDGKKAYEALLTAGYNKEKAVGNVAFKASFYPDSLDTNPTAKEYYDSLKLTPEQVEAKKTESATPVLAFLKSLSDEDWTALKGSTRSGSYPEGYISKPADLDKWTVDSKKQEILDLGETILNNAFSYDKESKYTKLLREITPNPSSVNSLKNKFKTLDISKTDFAAKKALIENLSTQELITIAHGYIKYIYEVKNSDYPQGLVNNFLNKEILIAEVANSDFATTYYLEAIKASVNSITPPAAAANVNPNSGTTGGSTVAATTPAAAAPVTAQTASTTPNATNRLDFSTIHLDTDYTTVIPEEKEFRRFMEIRQDIATINNAAGNPRIGDFNGSDRAISFALLSASNQDFPGKTKLDSDLLKAYNSEDPKKPFYEKYLRRLSSVGGSQDAEKFAQKKNNESKKYREESIKKLKEYILNIPDADWQILKKFGIDKTKYINEKTNTIIPEASYSNGETDEVKQNRNVGSFLFALSYNDIMNSKLKSINPDPTTVNELKSKIAKATTIEQKRAFMQSLNAKQSITIASLLEKQYSKIIELQDPDYNSPNHDLYYYGSEMYKDSIRFILDKNMLLAEIGNSEYGTTVYFDVIKYGLDSSTAPDASAVTTPKP